jgi:hypothetical protein
MYINGWGSPWMLRRSRESESRRDDSMPTVFPSLSSLLSKHKERTNYSKSFVTKPIKSMLLKHGQYNAYI